MATALLAACSAGQLAATSQIVPAIPGAQTAAPVGTPSAGTMPQTIGISNATLDYPGPDGYQVGDNAPISLWIFNNTTSDITLTGVFSSAGDVHITAGAHSSAVSPCLSSAVPIQPNPSTGAPTAGVEPSAGVSAGVSAPGPTGTPSTKSSAKPTGSATASHAESPSPSPSPSPTQLGSANINVPVKAFGCVVLNTQAAQYLFVSGLTDAVGSGRTVGLWFTFQQTGGPEVSLASQGKPLNVPVDTPASPASRGPAQSGG
jgi:hypothetical protein